MNKLLLLIISLSSFSSAVLAQNNSVPLCISAFNESTAIPFTRFVTRPIHPGIQAGTEFDYSSKLHHRWYQTFNAFYFYHKHLNQGIGINSEAGYEYRFNSGLSVSSLLGVGYLHTFAVAEEFTLKNGVYESKADRGNARLYPSLSFEAGYYLSEEANSPKIFIRYQAWIEYPYSPGFIPAMTHINLHLGAKFFINRK